MDLDAIGSEDDDVKADGGVLNACLLKACVMGGADEVFLLQVFVAGRGEELWMGASGSEIFD